MPRTVSLTMRQALTDEASGETPVVLVTITHPQLAEPIRLSTDPTERLSEDPLAYGTRSRGEVYQFVMVSAVLPDDREAGVTTTSLVFENVGQGMVEQVRAIRTPARVDFAVVLASAADHVEMEWTDLRTVSASYDAGQITIELTREPITDVPWPSGRMTKNRFPGLRR